MLSEKSRERKKTGLFTIEGLREIELALKGGYKIESLLFCSKIISEANVLELKERSNTDAEFIEVTTEVYQKIAYRASTEGVLADSKNKRFVVNKFRSAFQKPTDPCS